MISQAWMPAATAGAGVASRGIAIGTDLAVNTACEFIPCRKRHHEARRAHVKRFRYTP